MEVLTTVRSCYRSRTWKSIRQFGKLSPETLRQSELFETEKRRQLQNVGRIEKIDVHCSGSFKNSSLVMNRNISTPHDCAMHLGESVVDKSAVALLNGKQYWHMHKPLAESCELEFVHYQVPQPAVVNKAFWRTCSFLLGGLINNSFKENVNVQLHSFPIPNVRSGSFVYDTQLSLDNWKPTEQEKRSLSLELVKFCQQNHIVECLDVSIEVAMSLFQNNPHKTTQIPDIAAHNNGVVTVYRAGPHVDISKGPMVANTNHLGRLAVCHIEKLVTNLSGAPIYRFQGVALPRGIVLDHFSFGLLIENAKNLNPARIPSAEGLVTEENSFTPIPGY